jgi:hypothetical protein
MPHARIGEILSFLSDNPGSYYGYRCIAGNVGLQYRKADWADIPADRRIESSRGPCAMCGRVGTIIRIRR